MVPWSQKRQQILRELHKLPEDLPPPKGTAEAAVLAQVAHEAQRLANNLLTAAMLCVQVPWKTEADLPRVSSVAPSTSFSVQDSIRILLLRSERPLQQEQPCASCPSSATPRCLILTSLGVSVLVCKMRRPLSQS